MSNSCAFYKNPKTLIVLSFVIIVACFFIFDLRQYLSLEYIKSEQLNLKVFCNYNKVFSFLLFVLAYVFLTVLPFPVAMLMALLGGAVFGFPQGAVFIAFASPIGAVIAFILARNLLLDYVQKNHGAKLKAINDGIKKDGGYYLFALRLTPVFPYCLTNVLMGLTPMLAVTFFIISQIAMLPEIIMLTFLGQQLAVVNSLQDVISPSIMISLTILGLFPLLVKYALNKFKKDIK
jgi:uncharacterized membrane protein YdjX (TVP38/TMEM64 family)